MPKLVKVTLCLLVMYYAGSFFNYMFIKEDDNTKWNKSRDAYKEKLKRSGESFAMSAVREKILYECKFPPIDFDFSRTGSNTYIIYGMVSAQNGYGATQEKFWKVTATYRGGKWELESCELW